MAELTHIQEPDYHYNFSFSPPETLLLLHAALDAIDHPLTPDDIKPMLQTLIHQLRLALFNSRGEIGPPRR